MPAFLFAMPSKVSSKANDKDAKSLLFYFGTAAKTSKGTIVKSAIAYNSNLGYGFDANSVSNVNINSNSFSTTKPTYFSVKVPEGNYQIEIVLRSSETPSNVTIKAESRRLMLREFPMQKGQKITKTFNVNVRSIKIDDHTNISLKDREKEIFNWDDKLTLEFLGEVSIQSIKITPKDNLSCLSGRRFNGYRSGC